jgi:hypothetical protein
VPSEHFFQAQKFENRADQEEIRTANTPMIAARMWATASASSAATVVSHDHGAERARYPRVARTHDVRGHSRSAARSNVSMSAPRPTCACARATAARASSRRKPSRTSPA